MTPSESGDLRAEYLAIREALAQAGTADERQALKQRLMSLYRRTEQALTDLGQLKEDLRGLVVKWKQSGGPATAAMPQPPEARAAIRQDRLGASTYIEKGWHHISLGDHAAAVRALARALELAPEDGQALALLGWAQMLGEQHDEAMVTFGQVLERDPENALARVNVGYICLKKRIFGEAIEHLSRAIRLDSDRKATLYAHYYLGLVYLERQMDQDAVTFLERAVGLGPNLVEARYELGRALWFTGRKDDARATWTVGAQAGAFSPWSTRCRQVLELVSAGGEVPRSALP